MELLDQVHRENGTKSLTDVAAAMNLRARSRVSALLRGKALPADEDQAKDLIRAIGGSAEDEDRGLKLYRRARSASSRASDAVSSGLDRPGRALERHPDEAGGHRGRLKASPEAGELQEYSRAEHFPSDRFGVIGVALVHLAVADGLGWVLREESANDFGIDAYVEVVEDGRVDGRLLGLQIKCGPSFFREAADGGWWFRPGNDHVQYWLGHALPVAVVLCDPETQRCYWQLITPELLLPVAGGNRKMLVPSSQILDSSARGPLAAAAGRRGGETRPRPSRVFISYTSELAEYPDGGSYVAAVQEAVNRCGGEVVEMGDFPAASMPAAEVREDLVRSCDVFIGVLGTRDGSLVPGRDLSQTELEFEAATEAGIPRLMFLLDPEAAGSGLPAYQVARSRSEARQESFRQRVTENSGLTVRYFSSTVELGQLAEQSLRNLGRPETGAVRILPRPTAAGTAAGRPLPTVTDPFAMEVHQPVQVHGSPAGLPMYVRRRHDDELARVVRAAAGGASGAVVLVGASSTGKTRACWEALGPLREQEGWRVWHPIDPGRPEAALGELSRVGPRTVVWLNEAQFYLLAGEGAGERVAAGLRDLLRDAARAPVLVLATLLPQYWAELTVRPATGEPDSHAQARELLAGRDIAVPTALTSAEVDEAAASSDPQLALAAGQAGGGEVIQFLAGAPELISRYENAPTAARALLDAAIDARRLGMRPALPLDFLKAAAYGYIAANVRDALPDDWLNQALAWAGNGIYGLLTPHQAWPDTASGTRATFRLADYLEQHGRRERRACFPPEEFWSAAASYASSADLADLAAAAEGLGLSRDAALLRARATGLGSADPAQWATVRSLVSAGQYADAQAAIDTLAATDPDTTERLRRELGFVFLPEPDRDLVALAWRAAGAGHDERLSLDVREPAPEVAVSSEDAALAALAQVREASRPSQSSQQLGSTLEKATIALFQRMFTDVAPDTMLRLRRQPPGTQFGHDLELDWEEPGKPIVRCHVECKNLDSVVPTKDVAEKLVQQEFHHRDAPPDHWILISPHHDVSSELRTMLPVWEKEGRYPFGIRVWSPETGVRAWFALEPTVYEAVYGHPPTPEETRKAEVVAARYVEQLTPRLRVAPVWHRYLQDPKLICADGEPWQHFAELYRTHLPLKAANNQGSVLDGTLMEQVTAWARDEDDRKPRLLLADFGEGKSLFTYCLTRRLAEEFRAAPETGVFPLRIPLKDFKSGKSASALLEGRLRYIGPSNADWNILVGQVRTLVILDGFDEMSTDLSPAELTKNLDAIEACIEMFPDSKILITSRDRVLDGSNARRRTLDRLRKPVELRVAAGSRQERVEYLEQFATDPVLAGRLAALRDLYDPIGMAAKPLFLQMIKATLLAGDLPLTDFSEQVLYRSYIDQSLRQKHKLLRDPDGQLTEDELVQNLLCILEDVAIQLHESNVSYVYLRDYKRTPRERRLASMLWRISGQENEADQAELTQENEDDAVTRVGVRSLLKAAPAPDPGRWPVDFFHRSMREYFVAVAIVHSLGTEARDLERARRLLSAGPLLPEVAHFAASILKAGPDPAKALDALESLARSATRRSGEKYRGGNAVTLLRAAGGRLPHGDWPSLCLDHADLHGADLHDMNFARSSLRYANLNNANLERADLTDTDLEGIRLEETSRVLAVAAGTERIIVGYEDRTLREWRPAPASRWVSRVLTTLDHRPEHLSLTPMGRIVATGDDFLTVLDADGTDDPKEWCHFRTRSRVQSMTLGGQTVLLAEEADGGVWVSCLDATTGTVIDEYGAHGTATAYALADGKMYGVAASTETYLAETAGAGSRWGGYFEDRNVTCLALQAVPSGILFASGYQDGSVRLTRLSPDDHGDDDVRGWQDSLLWVQSLHDGPVTAITFTTEDQVVTGGADRSVRVTRVEPPRPGEPPVSAEPLRLTLRCRDVRCDDVRPTRIQQELRRLSSRQP